jgi:hypothetical protein
LSLLHAVVDRRAIARRAAGWNRISHRCAGSAVTCR